MEEQCILLLTVGLLEFSWGKPVVDALNKKFRVVLLVIDTGGFTAIVLRRSSKIIE
jgi:hypothetical protein